MIPGKQIYPCLATAFWFGNMGAWHLSQRYGKLDVTEE